jgi:hypothetical protein
MVYSRVLYFVGIKMNAINAIQHSADGNASDKKKFYLTQEGELVDTPSKIVDMQ